MQGLVSVTDVLKAIIGELAVPRGRGSPDRGAGGRHLAGGRSALDSRPQGAAGIERLPGEERRGFLTAGGLVMYALGQVPHAGDVVEVGGHRIEVVDMDGLRVDKLLIGPAREAGDQRIAGRGSAGSGVREPDRASGISGSAGNRPQT